LKIDIPLNFRLHTDELWSLERTPLIWQELTEEAIEAGAFGVPSMIFSEE
jgi:hypothetical protein